MIRKALEINEQTPWQEMTVGGEIYEGGTAIHVNTGDWRTVAPAFIEEKCNHCLLCVPFCPESSIPVEGGKRLDFDFKHCKGCGICFKVCPFGAITYGREEK